MRNSVKLKRIVQSVMMAILCALLVFGSSFATSMGFGFGPQQYKSGYSYGNGIYFAPFEFKVYAEPDTDSKVLKEFRWAHNTQSNSIESVQEDGVGQPVLADHVFFCFYPQLDVAMLAVVGENDNGWVEVIYDQAKDKTGWVPVKQAPTKEAAAEQLAPMFETPAHFGVYQTWVEFMKLNAKNNGIYWLNGVSQYQRSLRASDADEAKFVPITIVRDIKVKHVRGNWLLVEILDFERNTPIGWVRWRDNDGNLMVFPNLTGKKGPIVTTAY
jgi:hypothetical protein